MISGLSGVVGAFSAAQGAVALFAGENENLQKVMLKVQSLMSITIGLQQVANTINKDSAFMLTTVAKAKELLGGNQQINHSFRRFNHCGKGVDGYTYFGAFRRYYRDYSGTF